MRHAVTSACLIHFVRMFIVCQTLSLGLLLDAELILEHLKLLQA